MPTRMIQMRRHLLIPVSTRRDMKVPLHLIPLQTPVNPTRVRALPPAHPRPLRKLAPRIPPHFTQDMMHMRILLLRTQPVLVLMAKRLVLMCPAISLVVAFLHPQGPACILAFEQVAG